MKPPILRMPVSTHSFLAFLGVLLLGLLAGCGGGSPKMKIADINPEKNTFSFVDVQSGNKIVYQKLIFEGKEVVDTHCTQGISSVVFAFDDKTIVRSPGRVEISGGKGLTVHATIKYKLENGVLTILGTE